jgi:D-glycero-alpha-D-manno-heptose-7-phosphate kinase
MHEGWCLKRSIHPAVSNSEIDSLYEKARLAGAIGGKLLGAGGGGFLTFFAPPERHGEIEEALGLRRIDLALARSGSRVLLYHKQVTRSTARASS